MIPMSTLIKDRLAPYYLNCEATSTHDSYVNTNKGSPSILLSEEFLTKSVAELSVQEFITVITVVNEPLHHKLGSICKELGCKVKRVK